MRTTEPSGRRVSSNYFELPCYLRDIHGRTGSTGDRRDVYGAVVVGKRIDYLQVFLRGARG